ncbi:MAG: winged helix-turn-helix domain-containing protein [Terriglobales bacterium]
MVNKQRHFYEFGPYRVDPDRRQLLRASRPIPLQPKAFDILLVLVENREQVVLKDDLLKAVWPDTFVEESNLAQNVFVLRKTLGDAVEDKRYIVTVPGRGYRFAEKVNVITEGDDQGGEEDELVIETHTRSRLVVEEQQMPVKALPGRTRSLRNAILVATVVAVMIGAGGYLYLRRTPELTSQDTVVMADFANSTGDTVFDDTLRHGLGVALRQSPFLNVLSDDKVKSTLNLMTKPTGTAITKDIAREVCLRESSTAYIAGSIASLGNTYVLGLEAVNCQTGDTMAEQQATAPNKEQVMATLGKTASALRRELGESLASVQKFDVPLEQATTSSLDALKAYTQALRAQEKGDDFTAGKLESRAVELDANFARAYAALGTNYANLSQTNHASENYKKAFALRDRATNRERYFIEAAYYSHVTGETDRAIRTYQEWIENYPQDAIPHYNLAAKLGPLGRYEEATREMIAGLKSEPDDAGGHGVLIGLYLAQNRWDEARRTEQEAAARHLGGYVLRQKRYDIAFLNNDEAAMHALVAGTGNRESPDYLLVNTQAGSEAYHGRYRASRAYWQRAVEAATRDDSKETAAMWLAMAAEREAEVGNLSVALKNVQESKSLSFGKPVQLRGAIALARAGDSGHAQEIADALDKQYPLDTLVQNYYLPVVRAAISLNRHEPQRAIEALKQSEPYELGGLPTLYPAYIRGIAYLETGQGKEAAVEFQKVLDHRGITLNHVLGALAHLQLARAQAVAGDKNSARESYQDFFSLWKDADTDIPILKAAKAEYAKLQ